MHFDLNNNVIAIITLLAAVSANIVIVINAWSNRTSAAVTKEKLGVIHDLTNSNWTKVQEKLDALEKKASSDNETIHSLQEAIRNFSGTKDNSSHAS
jgi:hypothetical protein